VWSTSLVSEVYLGLLLLFVTCLLYLNFEACYCILCIGHWRRWLVTPWLQHRC
jgi:hypothetical protein